MEKVTYDKIVETFMIVLLRNWLIEYYLRISNYRKSGLLCQGNIGCRGRHVKAINFIAENAVLFAI